MRHKHKYVLGVAWCYVAGKGYDFNCNPAISFRSLFLSTLLCMVLTVVYSSA